MKRYLLIMAMLATVGTTTLRAQEAAPAPTATESAAPAAEGAADGTTPEGQAPEGETETVQRPPWANPLVPIALMLVVMYFFMFRGQRKRQREHQQMLDSVQKNARVRTIGGIIGTIVDVRDDEVVLKIDESTNTKMRVARSAIGKVLREEDEDTQN